MSTSARWTVLTLLGIGLWLAATVYTAATLADPSDPAPVLGTFAIGGGLFIALVLVGAGWDLRRNRRAVSSRLYRRLAVREVSERAARAVARRTSGTVPVHLAFAGISSGLMFTVIGLGEDGPYRELFLAMGGLLLVWLGFSGWALRRAFGVAGDLLAPLGLAVTGVPAWSAAGGGRLVGEIRLAGERAGRPVSVRQGTRAAVTEIRGRFRDRSVTSPTTIASLTGEPARCWRRVVARVGAGAVVVRRTGNGAGRWYLFDLLLAERLAELAAAEPAAPAG
jgi:hypothetical protein